MTAIQVGRMKQYQNGHTSKTFNLLQIFSHIFFNEDKAIHNVTVVTAALPKQRNINSREIL